MKFKKTPNQISSSEISVVVQGAVEKNVTNICLNSVRKCLPEAQIILSSWEQSNCSGLDYDFLTLGNDPGAYKNGNEGLLINTNRLIESTKNGLLKANRKYILKLRSDIILTSNNFLKYFHQFPKRSSDYFFFQERIMVSSFFTKKFISGNGFSIPTPFHLSDWITFGLKEDVKLLWDVPLVQEPDFSNYFLNKPTKYLKPKVLDIDGIQFLPEQYIFLRALQKKYPKITMLDYMDWNIENINISNQVILNNIIVIDPSNWSFMCHKAPYNKWIKASKNLPKEIIKSIYYEKDFIRDYNSEYENL